MLIFLLKFYSSGEVSGLALLCLTMIKTKKHILGGDCISGISETAQGVRALATKPAHLPSAPRADMVKGEEQPLQVFL